MSEKVLIAFFSMKGETLEGTQILYREKGHAQLAAEYIHDAVGGDLFEIECRQPYPDGHMRRVLKAREEIGRNARPEIKNFPGDLEQYDIVFLCFPIWWFTIPMPVATFLESLDWTGKRIIPVSTSNSSGGGRSTQDIRMLSKGADVSAGMELIGQTVEQHKTEIISWAAKQI